MTKPLPPFEYVDSRLAYCPDTGQLTWKYWSGGRLNWNRRLSGKTAGSLNRAGYYHVNLDQKFYPAHRVAWLLFWMEDPGAREVDHLNGDRADNRLENLRLATKSQNRMNMGQRSIWAKGVYLNQKGLFIAQIKINREAQYLGSYQSLEEASAAYDKKAKELFGDFACLKR